MENGGDNWVGGGESPRVEGWRDENDHDWACDGENAVGDGGDSELGVYEADGE